MRDGLTSMTRIEVVVNRADEPLVLDLFDMAGASGFTSVSNVSGAGHGGYHEGRLPFNDRDGLALVFTVVAEEQAGPLIDGLRALFEQRPGVMFVSDTFVSRPEYFRRPAADR